MRMSRNVGAVTTDVTSKETTDTIPGTRGGTKQHPISVDTERSAVRAPPHEAKNSTVAPPRARGATEASPLLRPHAASPLATPVSPACAPGGVVAPLTRTLSNAERAAANPQLARTELVPSPKSNLGLIVQRALHRSPPSVPAAPMPVRPSPAPPRLESLRDGASPARLPALAVGRTLPLPTSDGSADEDSDSARYEAEVAEALARSLAEAPPGTIDSPDETTDTSLQCTLALSIAEAPTSRGGRSGNESSSIGGSRDGGSRVPDGGDATWPLPPRQEHHTATVLPQSPSFRTAEAGLVAPHAIESPAVSVESPLLLDTLAALPDEMHALALDMARAMSDAPCEALAARLADVLGGTTRAADWRRIARLLKEATGGSGTHAEPAGRGVRIPPPSASGLDIALQRAAAKRASDNPGAAAPVKPARLTADMVCLTAPSVATAGFTAPPRRQPDSRGPPPTALDTLLLSPCTPASFVDLRDSGSADSGTDSSHEQISGAVTARLPTESQQLLVRRLKQRGGGCDGAGERCCVVGPAGESVSKGDTEIVAMLPAAIPCGFRYDPSTRRWVLSRAHYLVRHTAANPSLTARPCSPPPALRWLSPRRLCGGAPGEPQLDPPNNPITRTPIPAHAEDALHINRTRSTPTSRGSPAPTTVKSSATLGECAHLSSPTSAKARGNKDPCGGVEARVSAVTSACTDDMDEMSPPPILPARSKRQRKGTGGRATPHSADAVPCGAEIVADPSASTPLPAPPAASAGAPSPSVGGTASSTASQASTSPVRPPKKRHATSNSSEDGPILSEAREEDKFKRARECACVGDDSGDGDQAKVSSEAEDSDDQLAIAPSLFSRRRHRQHATRISQPRAVSPRQLGRTMSKAGISSSGFGDAAPLGIGHPDDAFVFAPSDLPIVSHTKPGSDLALRSAQALPSPSSADPLSPEGFLYDLRMAPRVERPKPPPLSALKGPPLAALPASVSGVPRVIYKLVGVVSHRGLAFLPLSAKGC